MSGRPVDVTQPSMLRRDHRRRGGLGEAVRKRRGFCSGIQRTPLLLLAGIAGLALAFGHCVGIAALRMERLMKGSSIVAIRDAEPGRDDGVVVRLMSEYISWAHERLAQEF